MTAWHTDEELVARYLDGSLDPVAVMSLEAHLAACPQCRAAVPADPVWLDASWLRIADEVTQPRRSAAERLLGRIIPNYIARLLMATPSLSRAWVFAVVFVLAFAVAAAQLSGGDPTALLAFLTVAPVLPLAGIAVAYGPLVDPAYESHAATPLAGSRLLLIRAASVLLAATLLTACAAPLVPGSLGLSVSWLLPGLMLTIAALAAGTRVPIPVAAGALALLWSAGVVLSQRVEKFLFFQPSAQAGYACAAAVLTVIVYLRRHRLDPGEPA